MLFIPKFKEMVAKSWRQKEICQRKKKNAKEFFGTLNQQQHLVPPKIPNQNSKKQPF